MNKIKLSASLALLMSYSAYAMEDMNAIEVVSTATKTQKSIDGVAATVDVVTQKEIEEMGAVSLKDIIERTPGIIMQYGTFLNASSKSKSSISIRGMGVNGTLMLIDGRRLAGEVANPYELERIPASIIKRIEIVKGPMSSLYGADAVGGVVNIITKKPTKETKIDVGARYGSNGDGDAQNTNLYFSVQGKKDAFGYSAYATLTTTKPYTQTEVADVYAKTPAGNVKPSAHPNPAISGKVKDTYNVDTTYREKSTVYTLGGRLSYDITSDLIAGFDVNYFNEDRDGTYIGYIHPASTPAGNVPIYNAPTNSHDENKRLDLSVDLEYAANDDLTLKTRIYNSSYKKRNSTTAIYWSDMGYASEDASSSAALDADVDLTVYELSATYLATDAHLLTAGGEYRDEKRKSTAFDNSTDMAEKTVEYKSVYLQDEWEVTDKFNIILGARYEDISNADDKPTFRVGGVYSFDKMANLRANFAQGFRTPDMREMYINKDTANGPQRGAEVMGYDLKPESTDAYELGISGRNKKFNYDLVGFYNQIKDKIQSTKVGTITTFQNVANAHTYGLELTLNYKITEKLASSFFWTELTTENEETKKDLEYNPKRSIKLGLDYQATRALKLGVIGKYIGEQYYVKTLNKGASTETNVDAHVSAYIVADLNVNYKLNKKVTLYGGINNVTDTTVDDVLGSSVGRYYFAGVRAHF